MGDNYLKNFYTENNEDIRFKKSKGNSVEFETTMHYIKKYLKPGMKILELGAATGAYSITLAKMGYNVTAFELLDCNLDVLKKKAKRIKNIIPIQGNALDLSMFEDNSFDIVLSLGPMYHLYSKKDDIKAIKEALRVCKKGGILFFAYIPHSSCVFYTGVVKNKFSEIENLIDEKGRIKNLQEDIFSSHFSEDFEAYFKNLNIKKLHHLASDGLATGLREIVDRLSPKNYKAFLKWHLNTCERYDQLGWSNHLLYICKKL